MSEKIVYFWDYCKNCKYEDVVETDDPCNECLTETANTDSHCPVEFVEKSST